MPDCPHTGRWLLGRTPLTRTPEAAQKVGFVELTMPFLVGKTETQVLEEIGYAGDLLQYWCQDCGAMFGQLIPPTVEESHA